MACSTLCGSLAEGKRTIYQLRTGLPHASGMLFLSRHGGADVSLLGGTLVSLGGYLAQVPIRTDESGRWSLEIPGSDQPGNFVFQVVMLRPSNPGQAVFGNAIRAEFGSR